MSIYDEAFYKDQMQESYLSAKEMIAYVKPYIPKIHNVIDIGCGVGTWLKAWKEIGGGGIDIFGIDGNNVDETLFYIPKQSYAQVDLTKNYKQISKSIEKKFKMKKFDLVESLEVAEHFDEKYAENFIQLLTSLGDIVLFSAAIPYQGGTHHVNEQPPYYWAKLFNQFDFVCFDIHPSFWDDDEIAFWYRQNTLLYVHKDKANLFDKAGLKPVSKPLHLVRPEYIKIYCENFKKFHTLYERRTFRYYWRHPKKIFSIFKKD